MKGLLGALSLSLAFSACSGRDSELPPDYRRVEVPESRLRSAEARARGRALFEAHCVLCHGPRADGRGTRREGLSVAPADFTDPAWRRRTSPRQAYFAIREGVRGTPMPGWRALGEPETWDLVAYVLSVGETAGD